MKKKKMKFDSGQLPKYLIYAIFCVVYFILSCNTEYQYDFYCAFLKMESLHWNRFRNF